LHRVGDRFGGGFQRAGRGELEQRFAGLRREVRRDMEKTVLVGRQHVGDPVLGHADRQQRVMFEALER
jgi:hypothetical protein